MLRKLLTNVRHLKTTVLGLASLLIASGAALSAFFDGDPDTVADWQSVTVAASALFSSLVLIFGSKDG